MLKTFRAQTQVFITLRETSKTETQANPPDARPSVAEEPGPAS